MRGKRAGVLGGLLLVAGMGFSQEVKPRAACRRVTVPGEVQYGVGFRQAIGNGLEVVLQPIASGWILRVVPLVGRAEKHGLSEHDYAELATPPYNSVSPLSISTDFSFRAQDAVGWNPRAFRFAPDRAAFLRLSAAYTKMMAAGVNPPPAAQQEMAKLVTQAYEGTFRILDARLIPGTADQWKMAAAVASHFTTTAHTLEQPTDGEDDPLGRLVWLRFQVELEVPASFAPAAGLRVEKHPCGVRLR